MLLTLRDIQLQIGAQTLIDGGTLTIEPDERVALIGRNGSGKSTLLRLVMGEVEPDRGVRELRQGARVTGLPQAPPGKRPGTVFEVVAEGLGRAGELARRHHDAAQRLAAGDDSAGDELQALDEELTANNAWQTAHQVEQVLTRLGLPSEEDFAHLSGGVQRRAMLARALVADPDLLVLDEPTNHLDIETIRWLEDYLINLNCALLFVSHDRSFLDSIATRIVDLDRGQLTSWPGNYAEFERRKAEALAAEEKARAEFDKKLAQEEAWIRQGVKARRKRNEGRVRELQGMREQRRQRRERSGRAEVTMQEAKKTGRLVVRAEGLGVERGDQPVVAGLDLDIMRGDRIGLVGPNGVGKTSLIEALLGNIEPTQGRVAHGTHLSVAYFDQQRAALDEDASIIDNVAGGSEHITVGGRSKHIIGYLQDFLFSGSQARGPVRNLSGGERSRVLLARLFAQPANVLVLDEPTNDLDIETLEVLEARLAAFTGTVLLVSHDRTFLDNAVTSLFVFEGHGQVSEHVGGYSDWAQYQANAKAVSQQQARERSEPGQRSKRQSQDSGAKLSYKDQRELDGLPAAIERLEGEMERIQAELADPALYEGNQGDKVSALNDELNETHKQLTQAYERWEELESKRASLAGESS